MASDNDFQQRFTANLERVSALLSADVGVRTLGDMTGSSPVADPGRSVAAELLRAAVVLLHASLEDVLRSVEELRLPTCSPEVFRDFGFVLPSAPNKRPTKVTLPELLEYRGQSIEDVLRATIREYLSTTNYNSATEVVVTLRRVGLSSTVAEQHAAELEVLMRRRHWIAHRADHDASAPPGVCRTRAVAAGDVVEWRDAVSAVGYDVLAQLALPGGPSC